jgi:hypothetical protein
MSPELQSKIAIWRQKAINGNLTADEMKEAITALRQDRVGASIASTTSRASKAKAPAPNVGDMLSELEDM